MNLFTFNVKRASRKMIFCAFFFIFTAVFAAAAETSPGKNAPDFTFRVADSSGALKKLSDYKGKPVVLHFWAAWCGPCIRELPLIEGLAASKSNELTVLAVNCGENYKTVSSFLSKRNIKLNLVMDENNEISRLYNINAIPQTFMIDENGVIRFARTGAYSRGELDRDVSALLKK
ncbi:MAG: TlpA family protein disulfide reductase [Spirochaetaceae bacterium]|jgi:peroxiredoxin|nr:TlpA family protein disulfide reductase [Spirochaetaceae bacterium]